MDGGFMNNTAPAMVKATDVYSRLQAGADQYIIDIRRAADFAAGHIQGAVNVELKDIVTHYEANNLQNKQYVVVTCYSGQSAGYAVAMLRLLGYSNVWDLKWGMCSWNQATAGGWKTHIGNSRAAQFTNTPYPKGPAGDLPTLSTGKTTGTEILRARVDALLGGGDWGNATIDHNAIYTNLSGYYIVNYWSLDHYNTGHIEGAMQYTPKQDLKYDTFIKTLPTDKPVVIYCYTGQTSAHWAAYLRILGYDAKTLVYGVNSMNYDAMPGTKFVEATEVHDYPLFQ
jgi:rhodanese-related sulfurtransferase